MTRSNSIDWPELARPLAAAEDAVARLDERLATSRIAQGWRERTHFADAAAALWLEGHLVLTEDLVLHDDSRDQRTPSHELAAAHSVLRSRRRIAREKPDWALSEPGFHALRGDVSEPDSELRSEQGARGGQADAGSSDEDRAWDDELADIDALLARTTQTLTRAGQGRRDPLVYDEDWNEDDRLDAWTGKVREARGLPPVLGAAVLLEAWSQLQPLQHRPGLGTLLAAAFLRAQDKTRHHLLPLNVGLRTVGFEKRRARSETTRLLASLEAVRAAAAAGLADHDRWILAHANLSRKLPGRRSTSRLPDLIEFAMSRPLVSTTTVAGALRVSQRAAQDLVVELGLREITGRGRYRAWAIL